MTSRYDRPAGAVTPVAFPVGCISGDDHCVRLFPAARLARTLCRLP